MTLEEIISEGLILMSVDTFTSSNESKRLEDAFESITWEGDGYVFIDSLFHEDDDEFLFYVSHSIDHLIEKVGKDLG